VKDITDYIFRFLLGFQQDEVLPVRIGYTNDFRQFDNFDIVIKASGFFDEQIFKKTESMPSLPLKIWEEVPILYGEPISEMIGNTLVVSADIVAGTFFLITRYEELIKPGERDEHGRFPGKASLPYMAGFIDRPIIEEWGKLLRQLMRENGFNIPEPPQKISKVYLTHDLDQLAHFRTIRGMLGGVLRGIRRPKEGRRAINSFFGRVSDDPWFTFPYIYKLDNELIDKLGDDRCEAILFVRSSGSKYREDKPFPNLLNPDYKSLIRLSKRKKINIGLHASYEAGFKPHLINSEKDKLAQATNTLIKYNRNHFLCSHESKDMKFLIEAGIEEDFTMGYADMAGFRLGTCRAVNYIDLENMQLTKLKLHPLTVMDGTLSEKKYMFMNAHDALQYCEQLIKTVENFNGELVLLWHNTMIEKTPSLYHRKLYSDIITLLKSK
jgi:hypothetical protein